MGGVFRFNAMNKAEKEDYLKLDALPPSSDHVPCGDGFVAVRAAHLTCLRQLTTNDLLQKDAHGETVLHQAARLKNHEAVKYICEKVPSLKEVPSQNSEVPAHISAAVGDLRTLEILLGDSLRNAMKSALHRDLNGTSVLMASVARGDNNMAFWLLKRFGKALAVLPNHAGMLPLHVAAAQGNVEFIRSAVKFDSQMVNARDEFGCTPCVYAVQAGCLSTVRYLVETARSEMGSVSNRGQSLLHIACLCGHEHVARWILNRTGNDAILWTTNDRANAVHCAAFCGSVACLDLLLSSFSRRKRRTVLASRDSRGNTPLHLAAINNHLDAALYMLDNHADPTLVNASGHSAQGVATLRGHRQMVDLLAGYNGKKKGKKGQPREVIKDYSPSGYSTSPAGQSGIASPRAATISPRDLSSGYSSAAEMYGESISSGMAVERHRMRFVEDGSDGLKDCAAQTENDHLRDQTKLLDDALWEGLGLSAVEQIDRVLEEISIHELSPIPSL